MFSSTVDLRSPRSHDNLDAKRVRNKRDVHSRIAHLKEIPSFPSQKLDLELE